VSVELVRLALLMAAVTYPFRAIPLLAARTEQLPRIVLEYLRLVGPSILAALAVANTAFTADADGPSRFYVGIEWLAVGAAVALVRWRRNVLLGIIAASLITAVARAVAVT
jgi:branched-subunit amino acid transport protein